MYFDLENNIGVLCAQKVSTKFIPRHEASKLSPLLCQVKFSISYSDELSMKLKYRARVNASFDGL